MPITKYACDQSMLQVTSAYQMHCQGETFQVSSLASLQPTVAQIFPYQSTSTTSYNQGDATSIDTSQFPLNDGTTNLNPSPFCPACQAEEQIFLWKGINSPPLSTIKNQTIWLIASLASHTSLHNLLGYGSGIRKFHIFCNIFTILEADHLPASFKLLHSFALWAATNPSMLGPGLADNIHFEPVSVAAICTCHLAQGWPAPLSDDDYTHINWSLHGLENLQGNHKRPICPPITIGMLEALHVTLDPDDPFKVCIWVMITCTLQGMMHFGEVSVSSHSASDKTKHLKQQDVFFGLD